MPPIAAPCHELASRCRTRKTFPVSPTPPALRFNPVNLVAAALLLLALLCAWCARLDLARGETKWFAWSRLAAPVTRRESPVRYWLAMAANIGVLLLFALVGAFAMRAGILCLAPR